MCLLGTKLRYYGREASALTASHPSSPTVFLWKQTNGCSIFLLDQKAKINQNINKKNKGCLCPPKLRNAENQDTQLAQNTPQS